MPTPVETPSAPARDQKAAATKPPDYGLGTDSMAATLVLEAIEDASTNTARKLRDRLDWWNLLFYRADQWSVWDKSTTRYVERGYNPEFGGLPAYVPRPVTNKFAVKIDGLAALLDQSNPAKEVVPSTNDAPDVAAAEVAEDGIPVLFEEIRYDELRARLNLLITLIDKVAVIVYYDTDPKYGEELIQDYECQVCGGMFEPKDVEADDGEMVGPGPCPDCKGELGPAIDKTTAEPLGQMAPVGRLCADEAPSFEFSLPRGARSADARDNRFVLFHTRMDWASVERRGWKAEKEKGAPGKHDQLSHHFADAMAQLAGPAFNSTEGASAQPIGPIVYRLYHDPIENEDYQFPDGLYAVMIQGQVVEAGPLPFKDDQDRPFKNVVIRQFHPAPGSAFGKPPGDDLRPIQERRNITEALLELILLHDAAPTTYIPLSVTLENPKTGAPGEDVYYRSAVPGDKPFTERGQNPPEGLYKQIDRLDKDMEEVSRLNAVLAGVKPEGEHTLGEVEILQERGMAAMKRPLDQVISFEKQLALICLHIARQSMWSPRFRKVMGENSEWQIREFVGAQLTGSVDIIIEPTSAWPKSPMLERLQAKDVVAMGLVGPPGTDPEVTDALLSMFHMSKLKKSLDVDRQQITRKLDRWKAATTPQEIGPPQPTIENLPLHFLLLTNFLKSEEFEDLVIANKPTADAMVAHVQQMAILMAPQPAPAPGGGEGDGAPAGRAGAPDPLADALDSGALAPAGAVSPADPLGAAVGAGALAPASATEPGVSIDTLVAARALTPLSGPNGAEAPPVR